MKNKRKAVYILCTAAPFAVWLVYFFISGFNFSLGSDRLLLAAFIAYSAVCVFSILYGALKYKCEAGEMSGKTALILTILNAASLIFMLYAVYSADFSAVPSACSVLLAIGSVSVLYWAVLTASKKENMTAQTLKKQLCLCILIPLAAALCLNFNSAHIADTLLMCAGTALLVAAVCFAFVYIFAHFNTKPENVSSENDGVNQNGSFYKFCNNTVLIIIFAIILPQICLWLNIGCDNFLGNYSSPAFFLIAFTNGILMLPAVRKKFFSLPYLYLKCVCFALIAYFTIAFIPVMPLGLIGIIVAGLGLLIFVPLFVFIIETGQLYYEIKLLKTKLKTGVIAFAIIGGLATIPTLFCINAAADRVNLNNALTYLDPYNQTYPAVDTPRLLSTMEKSNKADYRAPFVGDLFENGTPLLDGVYREIVLNGAYLTEDTKGKLDSIFNPYYFENYLAGESYDPLIDAERGDKDVVLKDADTHTYYDDRAGAWATEVTLSIKNESDTKFTNREFSADFQLPEGLIITDFWLDIDGEKREGLITDKRAALMTYDSVVTRMQDPAVIFYKDNNLLQLNVFPFAAGEMRECGFTVLHSDFELLEIDGILIPLEPEGAADITEFDGGALIPAEFISQYPESERKPYYCFAVDMSADSRTEDLINRLKEYVAAENITDGMIYFASSKVTAVPLSELDNIRMEGDKIRIGSEVIAKLGGYNLAGAFGAAQVDALKIKDEYYPALIAVTRYEKFSSRVLSQSDFSDEFPENKYYYVLSMYGDTDYLTAYDIANNNEAEYANKAEPVPCVVTLYGIAANNGSAQIVYNENIHPEKKSLYSDALALYANSIENPYDISNVQDSIYMNVLCPSTAFSVFETNEQIAQLQETQKKILSGEYIAQTGEPDTITMDEGSDVIFITVTAFVVITAVIKRKKFKKTH